MLDVDSERIVLVMNVNQWVRNAHGPLDQNNDYNRVILANMAGFVERIRVHLATNPFLRLADEQCQ